MSILTRTVRKYTSGKRELIVKLFGLVIYRKRLDDGGVS